MLTQTEDPVAQDVLHKWTGLDKQVLRDVCDAIDEVRNECGLHELVSMHADTRLSDLGLMAEDGLQVLFLVEEWRNSLLKSMDHNIWGALPWRNPPSDPRYADTGEYECTTVGQFAGLVLAYEYQKECER